jgi:uncharacterized membrane protein
MAQTRRKRRRKHRGTQGGSVDRRGRRGRPRTRDEARAQARRRAEVRRGVPSWGSAFRRGLLGSVIFFVLVAFVFGQGVAQGLVLSIVMLALYVPMGYYIDRFFWRRRRQQEMRARQEAKQARRG